MKQDLPTPTVFDKISNYWTEIAEANATERQVAFVESQLRAKGLVLDLACGSGRHAVTLSKSGYKLVGLDVSLSLLKIAKAKSAEASAALALVRADMRFLPFCSGAFWAVLSLDSSFGYLSSEAEDIQSFLEIARILQAKGLFLADVFNREHIMRHYGKKASTIMREYPSFWLTQKRSAMPELNLVQDIWAFLDKKTGKTTREKHVVRLYSCQQLQKQLEKAGFISFKIFGGYEEQSYAIDSGRLIIVSRRV